MDNQTIVNTLIKVKNTLGLLKLEGEQNWNIALNCISTLQQLIVELNKTTEVKE